MSGEYKSTCGCKIHVAQWTAKRKVVSQESCCLHKNAANLLAAAKAIYSLIESGMLVRSTANDHEEGWALKQVPLVKGLSQLKEAIAEAQGASRDRAL